MLDLIREMAQDWLGRILLALSAVVIALLLGLPFLLYQAAQEQKAWEAFAAEHRCRVVSVAPGATTMTPILVGKVTVLVPRVGPTSTTYLCDDERSYTQ